MNGIWDILSVAIGVSFIFMILSILNSWIQDYIASLFAIRAKNMADIMQNLLEPGATKLKGFERAKAPLGDLFGESTQEKKPSKHILKNEDTLIRIADSLQVSVADLRNANLKTLDKLTLPGDTVLKIPENVHKVEGNANTLEDLAVKYGTTTNKLLEENPDVLDELLLREGTELKIPETAFTVSGGNITLQILAETYGRSIEALLQKNRPAFEKLNLPGGTTLKIPELSYKAQENENPGGIAAKFGVSGEALKTANPNLPFDVPVPDGTEFIIPGTSHIVEGNAKTFTDIAKKYGRPAEALLVGNLEVLATLRLARKTRLTIPERIHTVEGDNTLKDIVKKYGQPIEILRKVNRKTLRTQPLLEWSDLKIPEVIFKVDRNGGTLEQVAKKYGRSTNVLWTANFDVLGQMLMPIDTRLTIPDPKANRYEVRERDNLNKIAVMLGVSVDDLKKANPEVQGIQPEDPLTVGITLKIPEQDIGQMASRKNVLEQLIANPVRTLYKYPTIHSLSKPNELPDRIPTKDFTVALLDLLDDIGRGKDGKKTSDRIEIKSIVQGIEKLESLGKYKQHPLAFRLRSLLYTAQINTQVKLKITEAEKTAQADIEEFQKAVSEWFDDTVARGSLWYKRRMQTIGVICGFLLAIFLNADTLGIANALWHNAILRESITQAAETSARLGQPTSKEAQTQLKELMDIGLPIGWSFDKPEAAGTTETTGDIVVTPKDSRALPTDLTGWVSKIIGLLLTGFAISQGSQIWFDLMNRLLNLRSAGVSSHAEESKEKEKSKQG